MNSIEDLGYKYIPSYDEWRKPILNGYYVVWQTPNKYSMWVISIVNKDDEIRELKRFTNQSDMKDYIKTNLVSDIRDDKIDYLLSNNS